MTMTESAASERTFTLELTGKEVEVLTIAMSIAMAAITHNVMAGGMGLAMIEVRGKEGRDALIKGNLKLAAVADEIPDNEWAESHQLPMAASSQVC